MHRLRSSFWVAVGFSLAIANTAALGDLVSTDTSRQAEILGGIRVDEPIKRASKLVREGHGEEALALIHSSANRYPQAYPDRLVLARLYFAENMPRQGRQALEQTVVESPNVGSVYLTFAMLALDEGRYSDAELNAGKARELLDLSKKDDAMAKALCAELYSSLAAVAEGRKDWRTAERRLRDWQEADPKNAYVRYRLGRVLFRLNKIDEASSELAQAAKDEPLLPSAGVTLAELYHQAGNAQKTIEWYEHATKAEPTRVSVRLAYARWLMMSGRADFALRMLDEAANLEPLSSDIKRLRGVVQWQRGDFAASERIFEELNRGPSKDAIVNGLLILSLIEQEDPVKHLRGLELAEASVRSTPQSREALATLGWAYFRNGQKEKASLLLNAAVSGGQASYEVGYYLARVLADQGKIDEARSLLISATSQPSFFMHKEQAVKYLNALRVRTIANSDRR